MSNAEVVEADAAEQLESPKFYLTDEIVLVSADYVGGYDYDADEELLRRKVPEIAVLSSAALNDIYRGWCEYVFMGEDDWLIPTDEAIAAFREYVLR